MLFLGMPAWTLLAALACAGCASGCFMMGEEHQERTSFGANVVRFEAVRANGDIAGSGCSLAGDAYDDRIRFQAEPGDIVKLTVLYKRHEEPLNGGSQHEGDNEYWCSKSGGQRLAQVSDALWCWETIEPNDSQDCRGFQNKSGEIVERQILPEGVDSSRLGAIDGVRLEIHVLGKGPQCVRVCESSGVQRVEKIAFVVE